MRAFCVRKMGWKVKVGVGVWRKVLVVVVSVRSGVDGVERWARVRRARRAKGEINWGMVVVFEGELGSGFVGSGNAVELMDARDLGSLH